MEPNHGGAETVVRGAEEPVLGEDQGPLSVPLLQPKPEEAVPRSGFFKTEIVWTNAIGFLVLHIVSVYAAYMYIYEVSWMTKLYAVVCYWLAAQGILLGAHRYYSHRAFKATEPLRLFMMFCNTLTGQNCMWVWVRDHRVHHKYSDTDADPHDASRGLFFSHMGWLMMRKLPEVIKRTREVDVTDLTADPLVMFQKKYYYPLYAACNLALMLVPMYAWNETAWNAFMITWVLRTTVMYNVTWSVNSFAHYLGNKPYDTSIRPVQLPWLSVFAFGEGWHNYHHAFPSDYKASEFGMPFNSTTGLIDFFAKIGWAYDLKEVSDNTVITKMQKKGDGSRKFVSRAG